MSIDSSDLPGNGRSDNTHSIANTLSIPIANQRMANDVSIGTPRSRRYFRSESNAMSTSKQSEQSKYKNKHLNAQLRSSGF